MLVQYEKSVGEPGELLIYFPVKSFFFASRGEKNAKSHQEPGYFWFRGSRGFPFKQYGPVYRRIFQVALHSRETKRPTKSYIRSLSHTLPNLSFLTSDSFARNFRKTRLFFPFFLSLMQSI